MFLAKARCSVRRTAQFRSARSRERCSGSRNRARGADHGADPGDDRVGQRRASRRAGCRRGVIAGNVVKPSDDKVYAYAAAADQLQGRFKATPVFGVPGCMTTSYRVTTSPMNFSAFAVISASRRIQIDFAKSVDVNGIRIGVVGINTSSGEFEVSQIVNACGGDPLAWARAHYAAILVTYSAAEHLVGEAQERWRAFGAGDVFDSSPPEARIPRDFRRDTSSSSSLTPTATLWSRFSAMASAGFDAKRFIRAWTRCRPRFRAVSSSPGSPKGYDRASGALPRDRIAARVARSQSADGRVARRRSSSCSGIRRGCTA